MHFLHSRNRWTYHQSTEQRLNFCLWVLQRDGLRVPPFDQHPDGDGSLRKLGLTEATWQAWFLRTLDSKQRHQDEEYLRQQSLTEYLKITGEPDLEHLGRRYQAEKLNISQAPPLPPPPEVHFYHASWQGCSPIRDQLIELGKVYQQEPNQLEQWFMHLMRAQEKEERKSGKRLYDELQTYAKHLPALKLFFVGYPYPLDYIVPPKTLLLTLQVGQPEPQEFRARVVAGVAELASYSKRRQKQSTYTKIEEHMGRFTSAYRRHERKSSSPTPIKQELPIRKDAAQQLVFERLAVDDNPTHGPIHFNTVHFLREKHRPGWRLYEITFQDNDGKHHRQIYILQQNQDGSWSSRISGGSSVDMQQEWPKLVTPVHDHPLLFLTSNGFYLNNTHYLLTAYGHVIDNGFQVARVRLTNDGGQVLEDTVDDGYVFFACQAEWQIQLPMQAELYNQQGKLVWRQTVLNASKRMFN